MKKKKAKRLVYSLVAAGFVFSYSCVPVLAQQPQEEENNVALSDIRNEDNTKVPVSEAAQKSENTDAEISVEIPAGEKQDTKEASVNENQNTEGISSDENQDTEEVLPAGSEQENAQTPDADAKKSLTSPAFGNIYIDLNADGKTDSSDKELLDKLITDYNMADHNGQEISGELSRILYGPLKSDTDTQAPASSSYYLNNAGESTTPKSQSPFAACWAFSSISALESSILKERAKLNGAEDGDRNHDAPVLEGLKDSVDISEKYLAWLAYNNGKDTEAQNEGISSKRDPDDIYNAGGLFGFADSLWPSWRGIVNESEEPYRAENYTGDFTDELNGITSDGLPAKWSISDAAHTVGDTKAPARVNKVISLPAPAVIEYKDGKNTWTAYDPEATRLIKQTLTETGAVGISYGADQSLSGESGNGDYFNYESWSQYNDSPYVRINHAVTIVGWDDNYPAANFKAEKNELPPADGAWLVKNSWGSYDYYKDVYGDTFTDYVQSLSDEQKKDAAWGIPGETGVGTGYFWLSYYDRSISSAIAFGVDIPDDGWDYDNIYQYNYYTDMANIPLVLRVYDKESATANIFTAKGEETLEAVSVRTVEPSSHVNVKVYLLDEDSDPNAPDTGRLVSETEADIELAGFTTLSLASQVKLKAGQSFAVVENIVADSGAKKEAVSFLNVETVLADDKQMDNNMGVARSFLASEAGQSFAKVLSGGVYAWLSPEALTAQMGEGIFNFGNALIKAFTSVITQNEDEPKPVPVHNDERSADGKGDEKEAVNVSKETDSTNKGISKAEDKAKYSIRVSREEPKPSVAPGQVTGGTQNNSPYITKADSAPTLKQVNAPQTGEKGAGIYIFAAAAATGLSLFFIRKFSH